MICWAILLASSSSIFDSLCLSRNLVISPSCFQILPFYSFCFYKVNYNIAMFASEVYSLTAFCLFLFLVSLTKSFGNPIVFEHLQMHVHVLYRKKVSLLVPVYVAFGLSLKAYLSVPRAEANLSSTSNVFSTQRPWCTRLSQSYLSLWELSCSFLVHGPQPKGLVSE